jgi:hypothetical protein
MNDISKLIWSLVEESETLTRERNNALAGEEKWREQAEYEQEKAAGFKKMYEELRDKVLPVGA